MALQFSRTGTRLAAAVCDGDVFPIRLFEIAGLANSPDVVPAASLCTLTGHNNLVYDMHWSFDDKLLLSASSDATARLWDLSGPVPSSQVCMPLYPPCASISVGLLIVLVCLRCISIFFVSCCVSFASFSFSLSLFLFFSLSLFLSFYLFLSLSLAASPARNSSTPASCTVAGCIRRVSSPQPPSRVASMAWCGSGSLRRASVPA